MRPSAQRAAAIDAASTRGSIGVSIAVGVAAFFAAALLPAPAAMIGASLDVPVSAPYITMLLAAAILTSLIAREKLGPRALLLASFTLLGTFPLLVLGAIYALGQPIVASHWRCGTGEMGLFMLAPFVLAGTTCVSFLVALAVARNRSPVLDRGLRFAAGLLFAVLLPLSLAAAWHARGRPDPDGYVASLPVVAELAPPDDGAKRTDSIAGITLERGPDRRSETGACGAAIDGVPVDRLNGCEAIEVRRDPRGDILVFLPVRPPSTSPVWPLMAYRLSEKRAVDVGVADIAPLVSAPRGWIATGLGASCIAAIALFFGLWRARRERTSASRLTDARHDGGGWLTFARAEGELRVHVPLAESLPLGPAVTELRGGGPGAYRDTGAPEVLRARAGTVADLVRAATDVATAWSSFALLALACGLAPLLAAMLGGVAF